MDLNQLEKKVNEIVKKYTKKELEEFLENYEQIIKNLENIETNSKYNKYKELIEFLKFVIENFGTKGIEAVIQICNIGYSKYDATQLAKKIKANSTLYGISGTNNSRFYFIPFVEGITTAGKTLLLQVVKFVKKEFGLEVLYGDTDSMFIHIEPIVPKEIKEKVEKENDFGALREWVYKWLEEVLYPKLNQFIDWYMWEYYRIPKEEHFYDFKTEIIISKAIFLKGKEHQSQKKNEKETKIKKWEYGIEISLLSPIYNQYFNQFFDKDKYMKYEAKKYKMLQNEDYFTEILQEEFKDYIYNKVKKIINGNIKEKSWGNNSSFIKEIGFNEFIENFDFEKQIKPKVLEYIENEKSLYGVKKKYILHIIDKEKVEVNDFVYQGVDIKRSELPKLVKDYIKIVIENFISKNKTKEYIVKKLELLDKILTLYGYIWKYENIGIYKSISKSIEKYETKVYTIEGGKLYNTFAKIFNLPKIETGNKIVLIYIQNIDTILLKKVLTELKQYRILGDKSILENEIEKFIKVIKNEENKLSLEDIYFGILKQIIPNTYSVMLDTLFINRNRNIIENLINDINQIFSNEKEFIKELEKKDIDIFIPKNFEELDNIIINKKVWIKNNLLSFNIISYDEYNDFNLPQFGIKETADYILNYIIPKFENLLEKTYFDIIKQFGTEQKFYISIPTHLKLTDLPILIPNLLRIDINKIKDINIWSKMEGILNVIND